ncbi:MAG TPA: protein kinase [Gemmatimonadaceae bacterium]|nr:protein kinase [Gemmatimonadaceae bacterium]
MEMREQLQRTLGNAYILEQELGGGGMSQVFVAEEVAFGRKVVVKVLPPGRTGDVNIERFKREIQVAARLQHAHIVPVLTAGETNGLPYYTMPFVEGESLRTRLSRLGPLSSSETVNILRDVARALAYAHERGVVHRDIKPDNVMVAGGSAVVTDFGIAKAISASRTDTPNETLTQVGTSLGTPAYMAPEQAAGDPATDHRADLYAFGCMAYEMLAGEPPFVEKSPQLLLAAHMSKTADPVTGRRADVPQPLASMIAQCLAKDPGERPSSAADVARVLDTTSTDSQGAFPPILLSGKGMLGRMLGMYAVAFIAVAVVAKAAVTTIGLPNWVFPGAIIVMALGLPAILATGYVQRVVRRAAGITPTTGGAYGPGTQGTLATLAMKASPHMSWRRTQLGGLYAVSGFVLLVGVFMLLRTLGIGPAGSLLAAGTFDSKEPILVTDFSVTNADSSLGRVLSDATKTTLSESSVITLLPPEGVAAALARMERPRTTAIDLALAREMASRNAIKAIVDGQITGVAGNGGYIVTLRLVTADSLKELASFTETADDTRGLIEAIDKLSRALRGKIGESLKDVNAAPSLAEVTTASFEALRKYTEADRAEITDGDRPRAIRLLREAVAIDSTFAEAWRRLAIVQANAGRPRAVLDSAYEAAYRHRHRTSARERAMIEATYFSSTGPNRDRAKGILAYEEMLKLGDSARAANNLAIRLSNRREFARAETLYRVSARLRPDLQRLSIPNLLGPLIFQQKFAEAESLLVIARSRYPQNNAVRRTHIELLYHKGDLAGYRRAIDSVVTRGDTLDRTWAKRRAATLAMLEGDIREFTRVWRELDDRNLSDPRQRLFQATDLPTFARAEILGQNEAVVRELDAAITAASGSFANGDWPYFGIIDLYALAGQPQRARQWLNRYDAEVKDTFRLRIEANARRRTLAEVLMAERKGLEAATEFRRSDSLPDGPDGACLVCLPMRLAFAFSEAEMSDSAIHYMQQALTTFDPNRMDDIIDPYILPLFNKRLGELYEARGDRVKAAEHYRKVIEIWKNADPEVQVIVNELKARVRRLTDLEGIPR